MLHSDNNFCRLARIGIRFGAANRGLLRARWHRRIENADGRLVSAGRKAAAAGAAASKRDLGPLLLQRVVIPARGRLPRTARDWGCGAREAQLAAGSGVGAGAGAAAAGLQLQAWERPPSFFADSFGASSPISRPTFGRFSAPTSGDFLAFFADFFACSSKPLRGFLGGFLLRRHNTLSWLS